MNWIVVSLIAAFVTGFAGTWWVRRYAVSRVLLDVPNDRSSHSVPTPRGGGLSIAIVVMATILALGLAGRLPGMLLGALLPAALLVTVIGWIDDHRPLPAVVRGVSYLLAAAWFVWFIGGMGSISLGGHTPHVEKGSRVGGVRDVTDWIASLPLAMTAGNGGEKDVTDWIASRSLAMTGGSGGKDVTDWIASRSLAMTGQGSEEMASLSLAMTKGNEAEKGSDVSVILISILLVIGIAWLTNLYNFMDGTDGLAGLQGLLAGAAGGWLLWWQGGVSLALLAWMAAAACGGFLIWNWAPAKIFMGDVGSCLLGFLFGCLAVAGEKYAGLPVLLWVILLGFFIWDATLTLLMRVVSGERWYSAHKSHAYQRLVQSGMSHARLAILFAAFNLLVLWPLTWWGYQQPNVLLPVTAFSMLLNGLIWVSIQVYYKQIKTTD